MKLKINRDWRKWSDENNDTHAPRVVVGSEEGSGGSQTSRSIKNNIPSKLKIKKVPTAKLNNKSNKMYDAGKELYANNKLVSKTSKAHVYNTQSLYDRVENINQTIKENIDDLTGDERKQLDKRINDIYDFESQLHYSRYNDIERDDSGKINNKKLDTNQNFKHNEHNAPSLGIDYYKSRNRRYGTDFANLIGKLAEDNSGVDVEGDDFWDERLLTERVVTKYSVNKCKKDRTKERIVLMLDTSPSCKRVASFYGLIAQLAAKYDDIELYDAPNGRIVHKYCRRTKDFIPIWNEEDIYNRAYEWKYLKNRTVLLFSDSDCIPVIRKNMGVNTMIVMAHDENNDMAYRSERLKALGKKLENNGGKLYHNINSPDKLVEVIKKLK